MNVLNKSQKHLFADYLNNISAGWFLLGVVTPVLTNVKIDIMNLSKIFFSLLISLMIIIFAIATVKK